MGKLYIRLHKSLFYIFYILTLLQLYVRYYLISDNHTVPIDQWLITNNTITILVNSVFLLFQMKKVGVLRSVRDTILLRMDKERFQFQLLKISAIGLLLYFLGTYGVLTLLNIHSMVIVKVFIFFIMLNIVLFSFYEWLFNYAICKDKNRNLLMVLPFALNILFHYFIVPLLFY